MMFARRKNFEQSSHWYKGTIPSYEPGEVSKGFCKDRMDLKDGDPSFG